jgi:hypothetical protein
MRYTVTDTNATASQKLSEVLNGTGKGPRLTIAGGVRIADCSSNFLSLIPYAVRSGYDEVDSTGVYTSGRFNNQNEMVCVSGLATCAAVIGVRGSSQANNFSEYLAIHLGGDERGIQYFEKTIGQWVQETNNGKTIWVVGTSPNGKDHLTTVWEDSVVDFFGVDRGHMLFYGIATSLALRQDGQVGEPVGTAPSSDRGSKCCTIL